MQCKKQIEKTVLEQDRDVVAPMKRRLVHMQASNTGSIPSGEGGEDPKNKVKC